MHLKAMGWMCINGIIMVQAYMIFVAAVQKATFQAMRREANPLKLPCAHVGCAADESVH